MIGPKKPSLTPADERDAYELVTLRDDDTCQRCRRARGTNRDHRKNRSQGGFTVVSNLQLLCGTGTTGCHGWAHAHPRDAIADGWAVPGWADPAQWPARRWVKSVYGLRLAWVLYGDDGSVREIAEHLAHELMGGI